MVRYCYTVCLRVKVFILFLRMDVTMKPLVLSAIALITLSACQPNNQAPESSSETSAASSAKSEMFIDGIDSSLTGEQFTQLCDSVMAQARQDFETLESDTSPATLASVVGGFDQITYNMQSIRHSWYMKAVHPDEAVRDAATDCSQRYSDFLSQVGLSRGYYERLAAIDLSTLKPEEKYMVEQGVSAFTRAGVDKDEASRDKIRALRKEITEIGNVFDKNIREDVRYVTTTVAELKGLPQDYIDARPADESGHIEISTDYPDLYPVMTYAQNDELGKALRLASRSRGYPQN